MPTDLVFTHDSTFATAATALQEVGGDSLMGDGTGGIIGGSLGWILGIDAMMIPGRHGRKQGCAIQTKGSASPSVSVASGNSGR